MVASSVQFGRPRGGAAPSVVVHRGHDWGVRRAYTAWRLRRKNLARRYGRNLRAVAEQTAGRTAIAARIHTPRRTGLFGAYLLDRFGRVVGDTHCVCICQSGWQEKHNRQKHERPNQKPFQYRCTLERHIS